MNPTKAETDVLAERAKQRAKWGNAHDDDHRGDELADAAAMLAYSMRLDELTEVAPPWALALANEHALDRRRELVIAAALLLAEIERIDRGGE